MESIPVGSVLIDSLGAVPFLGYHHVLMILIAVTIILLCKCFDSKIPRDIELILFQLYY